MDSRSASKSRRPPLSPCPSQRNAPRQGHIPGRSSPLPGKGTPESHVNKENVPFRALALSEHPRLEKPSLSPMELQGPRAGVLTASNGATTAYGEDMTHSILASGAALESPCGNNKRRRSTARRVSFAEAPQIRHFQQDDDEWGDPHPQAQQPQLQPHASRQESGGPPAKSARVEDAPAVMQPPAGGDHVRSAPASARASAQLLPCSAGMPAVSLPVMACQSMPAGRTFTCDRISEDSGQSVRWQGPAAQDACEAATSNMAMSPPTTNVTVSSIMGSGTRAQHLAGAGMATAWPMCDAVGAEGGITASIPRLAEIVADDWTQEVAPRRASLPMAQDPWVGHGPRDVSEHAENGHEGITASIPRLSDLVADDWTQEVAMPQARRSLLPPALAPQDRVVTDAAAGAHQQTVGAPTWPKGPIAHSAPENSSKGDSSQRGGQVSGAAHSSNERRTSLGGGVGAFPPVMISAVRRSGHQPARRPLGEVKLVTSQVPQAAPAAVPENAVPPPQPAFGSIGMSQSLPLGDVAGEGITASVPRLSDLVADDWTQELPAAPRASLTFSLQPMYAGSMGGAGPALARAPEADGITASIPRLPDLVAADWTQEMPKHGTAASTNAAAPPLDAGKEARQGWAGSVDHGHEGITASIPRLSDLVADDWTQEVAMPQAATVLEQQPQPPQQQMRPQAKGQPEVLQPRTRKQQEQPPPPPQQQVQPASLQHLPSQQALQRLPSLSHVVDMRPPPPPARTVVRMATLDAQAEITASIPRLSDLVAGDWTQEVATVPVPMMETATTATAASSSKMGKPDLSSGINTSDMSTGERLEPKGLGQASPGRPGMVHQGSSDSLVSSAPPLTMDYDPASRPDISVPGTVPQEPAAAPILSVSDFLYLAEVRFLDEEASRRNTSFGGMEDTGSSRLPSSMEECLRLMCLLEPEASTLEFGCEQLRETISEKKRTLAAMEETLSGNNPPIFRHLQLATGDELADMQAALRNLKLQCKLLTKSDWLMWRSKLEHTTRARLDENRRLLGEDKDAIGRNVGLVRDVAAMLRTATSKAQEQLAARHAVQEALQGSIARVKVDIEAAAAKEAEARQRLEGQRVRADILAERKQSLLEEKARLQAAITEARRSCEQAGAPPPRQAQGEAAASITSNDTSQRFMPGISNTSPAIMMAEAEAANALDDLQLLSAVQGLQLVPAAAASTRAYGAGCGFIAPSLAEEGVREVSGSASPSVELVLRGPLPCLSIRVSVGTAAWASREQIRHAADVSTSHGPAQEDAAPVHASATLLLTSGGEGKHYKGISDQLPIILDTLQVDPARAAELSAAFAPGNETTALRPCIISEWSTGDLATMQRHIQSSVLAAESARLLLQDVAEARRNCPLLAASQYQPRTASAGGALALTFIDFHSESKFRITLGLDQWSSSPGNVLPRAGYPFSSFSCKAEIIYRGFLAASASGRDEMAMLGHGSGVLGRPSQHEDKEWFTEESIVDVVDQTTPGLGYLERICSRLSVFLAHDSIF